VDKKKMYKMNTRKMLLFILTIVLASMILLDFSLHYVEYIEDKESHPFYEFFWSFPNRKALNDFWTSYWGLASFLIVLQAIIIFYPELKIIKEKLVG
jgi:hypothetical protein